MTDEPLKRIGFPEKQDSYLSRARKERKMADEPIHCKICGSPSITNQSEQLCYICDEKEPPLKTLKEMAIAIDGTPNPCVPRITLRAEAIRHAKKQRKDALRHRERNFPEAEIGCQYIVAWIQDFFNLTEENLK